MSPARTNPSNDIILELTDNVDASYVEVMQAEVLNDDKDNSDDDRKLPASKTDNDDEGNSNDNRKMQRQWQEDVNMQKW